MGLTNCFQCKGRVSTSAEVCPGCGLERPHDHPWHLNREIQEITGRNGDAGDLTAEEERSLFLEQYDDRDRATFLAETTVPCADCGAAHVLKKALGTFCADCGRAVAVECVYCGTRAHRLVRVNGRWLTVCDQATHTMVDREYYELMSNINKTDTHMERRRIVMCRECRTLGEGFEHFEVKEAFVEGNFHYFPVHRNRLLCDALADLRTRSEQQRIKNPFDV